MAKIRMEGEHRIVIDFNSSHSCSHWIKEIRQIFEENEVEKTHECYHENCNSIDTHEVRFGSSLVVLKAWSCKKHEELLY